MSTKAGALLWNRQRITLAGGLTAFDTGLAQIGKAFGDMSLNEPPLGATSAPPGPPDGTLPASRIMVIPEAPTAAWASVTHGEPYRNPATNTMWVTFSNDGGSTTINVLFWNPHSSMGPGDADTYNAP